MAANTSAEASSAEAAGAAAVAAFDLALRCGTCSYSSTAAFLITTLSRSFTLVSNTTRVSDSFHIRVTSVSPGNTLSAKRTLMLLNLRGSLPAKALMTWRPTNP